MQEMISYVLNYYDKPIENTNTVKNFIRGRKLININNNKESDASKRQNMSERDIEFVK